jgi:riboflavin kinase/FMN adenylyltransferase
MHVLTTEIDQLSLPAELAQSGVVLTVGAFDGIHLGHQTLIRQSIASARVLSYAAGLVTFCPHPAAVLYPDRAPQILTSRQVKLDLLRAEGLDLVALLLFTGRLRDASPRDFVQALCSRLHMRELWVGPDFALGKDRSGDLAALEALQCSLGFTVHQVPYVTQDGRRISSSQIRALLASGRVAEAAQLLGRWYSLRGRVIHGKKLGRTIGFPTANLQICPDCLIPAYGVYATTATVDGVQYAAATNVGVRPSVDNGPPSVEAFILDYDRDLYGHEIELAFVRFLRPEMRFENVQGLIDQMRRDVVQTRRVLQEEGGNDNV